LDGVVVLRELSKAIRNAERLINTLNPPKPERESKRMKKKPVNKDFVDLSQPLSTKVAQEVKFYHKKINYLLNSVFSSSESESESHQQQIRLSVRAV